MKKILSIAAVTAASLVSVNVSALDVTAGPAAVTMSASTVDDRTWDISPTLDAGGNPISYIRQGFQFRVSDGNFMSFIEGAAGSSISVGASAQRGNVGTGFGAATNIGNGSLLNCGATNANAQNTAAPAVSEDNCS